MVFSSPVFLFGFLPITLAVYYLSPRRLRNGVLLLFSLLFYGWGEPILILVMVVSVLSAYLLGFGVAKYRVTRPRLGKRLAILSIGINLSLLFFFKYSRFFAEAVGLSPLWELALPIGISFYTFQILSYTVDLWRGEIPLQRSLVAFGTYVALFPQLVAGPIVRYRDVNEDLLNRRECVGRVAAGVERFCCGLAKKLLLGDVLWEGYRYFTALSAFHNTALGAWLAVILYTLHLYYDFSGYSDMAIGLGRMLGFSFPENFNYPYVSKSITEFWRRWHITLSSWFREYVYIPLGGNRRGRLKQCRNLAIVWLLTGLWHGAAWNFVLWGAYFCVILICEHLFLRRLLERAPSWVGHCYTLTLVLFSFLIFSSAEPSVGLRLFRAMLGSGVVGLTSETVTYRALRLLPTILIAAVGATPLPKQQWDRLRAHRPRVPLATAAVAMALWICTAYLANNSFRPFAYLNF